MRVQMIRVEINVGIVGPPQGIGGVDAAAPVTGADGRDRVRGANHRGRMVRPLARAVHHLILELPREELRVVPEKANELARVLILAGDDIGVSVLLLNQADELAVADEAPLEGRQGVEVLALIPRDAEGFQGPLVVVRGLGVVFVDGEHEADVMLARQVHVAQHLREQRHVHAPDDVHRLHASGGVRAEHEAHCGHALAGEEFEPVGKLLLRGLHEREHLPTLFAVSREPDPVGIETTEREPGGAIRAFAEVRVRPEDDGVCAGLRGQQTDRARLSTQALVVLHADAVDPALRFIAAPDGFRTPVRRKRICRVRERGGPVGAPR